MKHIKEYLVRHADELAKPNAHLGTWVDDETTSKCANPPCVYMDVSVVVGSAKEAAAISARTNQIAFFDLGERTPWRRDKSGSYSSVSKAVHSPVVYTRAADLQTDEEIRSLVEFLLKRTISKHARHDQKTHGSWARGGGGILQDPKWTKEGELVRSEKLRSPKRQKDAKRVKRLQDLGVLPDEKRVDFTNPGDGIRELTWSAGELPGEALVASSFGWSQQPITVDPGGVPLGADVLARLTDQVHETLGELSPEFRVRNIEVTDEASPGGGQYSGGTTLKISPWAIPMTVEERTALADELYGESKPAFIDSLNQTSETWQADALAKTVQHESGHYIENQLRLRTSKPPTTSIVDRPPGGNRWWLEWSNKVAPAWEAETEHFFRQEFASGSHQSLTRFRDNPLFYTAATHGWSGDRQFEGTLRGVGQSSTRNAELFAEYVRFEMSGLSFPNGDMIGAHIRKATAMPGVTAGDGDGYTPVSGPTRWANAYGSGYVQGEDERQV